MLHFLVLAFYRICPAKKIGGRFGLVLVFGFFPMQVMKHPTQTFVKGRYCSCKWEVQGQGCFVTLSRPCASAGLGTFPLQLYLQFIFSCASQMPATTLDWTSSWCIRRRGWPSPSQHLCKHLVLTGSDQVLVGPIPNPVSVVWELPMLE